MVRPFGTNFKAFSFVYWFSFNQIIDEYEPHEARNETHRSNLNGDQNTGGNGYDLPFEPNISNQLANFSDGPERQMDYGMLLSSFFIGFTCYYCD